VPIGAEPLLLGLALGVKHALEPDHVAAITTMVDGATGARAAARTGAAWGLGHAVAIVLFGGTLVALGLQVPPRLALALDLAVASMLVALGIHAFVTHRKARRPHAHRSTLVGFVHGASGTAALTLVYVAKIPSRTAALIFLVLFAVGSLLSMSAMSGLLAKPFGAVARRGERAARALRIAGGVTAFGAAILVAVQAFGD
jgi:hypothetical protein